MGVKKESSIVSRAFRAASALLAALLAALSVAAVPAFATKGSEQIRIDYAGLKVNVDGSAVILLDANGSVVYPFTYKDRTYLPVRAVASALSCGVTWVDAKSEVQITSDGGGEPAFGVPRTTRGFGTITVEYRDISITVDGKSISLGADEPFLFDDSVYVPFRAVADALGLTVGFDAASGAVLITGGAAGSDEGDQQIKPDEPADVGAAPAGSFAAEDLAVQIGDRRVALGQNADVFMDALGEGYYYEEALSCAYGGVDASGADKMDKKYAYDGIAFSTLPIEGDVISAIDIDAAETSGAPLSTTKGVAIGDAMDDAIAAYGDGYTYDEDFGELTYWLGEPGNPKTPQLFFQIGAGGVIEFISAYDGKAAG